MNRTFKQLDQYQKVTYYTELEQLIDIHKINIKVDKLKLCYNVFNDIIIRELNDNKPEIYHLFDFELVRLEGKHFNDTYQIRYCDTNDKGEIVPHVFGELKFNLKSQSNKENDSEETQRVWIYVNNYILYSRGNRKIVHLSFISEKLGLTLNNITGIEIAIDTDKNVPKRLKQCFRNKSIITLLNNKVVLDRKIDRPEIEFIHSGDLNRYKYMSVYIKQQKAMNNKSNGTIVCTYDKLSECKNSEKDYVLDHYNNPTKLFRIEVRATNENFKKFLEKYQIELTEPLLWNKGFLLEAFIYFFSSVIRFKENGKEISIWELFY